MSLAAHHSRSTVDVTLCAHCVGGYGVTHRLASRPEGGVFTYQTCNACGLSWVLAVFRRNGSYVVERLATSDAG